MGTWREDVIKAIEQSGGIAKLVDIYALVKSYRGTVPPSYQAMIRRTIETASSSSRVWDKKNDIFYSANGIGEGTWGLRITQKLTPFAVDINDPNPHITGGNFEPERVSTQIYRVIRDTKLCRDIKNLYNHKCQICDLTIILPSGGNYAEAHHLIPLGSPHKGADKPENIIVVCPNHHAMLDYGAIHLDPTAIADSTKHKISADSIEYHNTVVCKELALSMQKS
jgi:hypothetical protein